eukprot:8163998-Lingulodinium_polyedra.AAC.1
MDQEGPGHSSQHCVQRGSEGVQIPSPQGPSPAQAEPAQHCVLRGSVGGDAWQGLVERGQAAQLGTLAQTLAQTGVEDADLDTRTS